MNRPRPAVRVFLRAALVLSALVPAVAAQRGPDPLAESHPEVLERIAFGSCAFEYKPQPIWTTIAEQRPQLWIWAGDNIYIDIDGPEEAKYAEETATVEGFVERTKRKYAALAGVPEYQDLLASEPFWLATWDDHDFGLNDAGVEFRYKRESQELFHDFHGTATDSARRSREGVYHCASYGPEGQRVQVIVLDTRYHRSALQSFRSEGRRGRGYRPVRDRGATMLGDAQWQWLESRLREPADLRIVVSSIQFVSEEHPYEKWSNLPNERSRMLRLIEETGAKGVLFISGDRHHGELSKLHRDGDYPIYDLTASGLTQSRRRETYRLPEANIHRVGRVANGPHFGSFDIDWSQPDPRVTMRVTYGDREVPVEHSLTLSELGRPVAPAIGKGDDDKPDGERIVVDGRFDDWDVQDSVVADSKHVFVRFRTVDTRNLTIGDETVRVALDLDANDETGATRLDLAGTDLLIEFAPKTEGGRRNPYRYQPRILAVGDDGAVEELRAGDVGLHFQPGHASDRFELRFSRFAKFAERLVWAGPGTIEVRVRADAKSGGVQRVLVNDSAKRAQTIPAMPQDASSRGHQSWLAKDEGAIRVVSWNVLWGSPQDDEHRQKFSRIFKALKPDVILLQEWDQSRYSEVELAAWFRDHVDSSVQWSTMVTGTQGYGQGTAVATWHPVVAKAPPYLPVESGRWNFAMRLAAAAIDTPVGRVLAGSVHLKASGALNTPEDERRMAEAVSANALMRGMAAGVQPDLIVLGGDLNMNGTTEVERLLFRDLDLDRSSLARARPTQLGDPELVYTFGRSDSKARLDYLGYSEVSAEATKSFVFDTTLMSEIELDHLGVQKMDAHGSDHLPVVLDLRPSVIRRR